MNAYIVWSESWYESFCVFLSWPELEVDLALSPALKVGSIQAYRPSGVRGCSTKIYQQSAIKLEDWPAELDKCLTECGQEVY